RRASGRRGGGPAGRSGSRWTPGRLREFPLLRRLSVLGPWSSRLENPALAYRTYQPGRGLVNALVALSESRRDGSISPRPLPGEACPARPRRGAAAYDYNRGTEALSPPWATFFSLFMAPPQSPGPAALYHREVTE